MGMAFLVLNVEQRFINGTVFQFFFLLKEDLQK